MVEAMVAGGRFSRRASGGTVTDCVKFQWSELLLLLAHVFTTVPYYQRKYAAAGIRLEDIKGLEDFSRLPPLTQEEVNANREELSSATLQE